MLYRILMLMIWVALTALTGCAEEATSGSDAPTVCAPNETLECTCVDGETGYQLCNEDGSGYAAPCECTGTGEGGDEDAGGESGAKDGSGGEEAELDALDEDSGEEGSETPADNDAGDEEDAEQEDTNQEGGEEDATTDAEGGEESTDAEGGEESTEGGDDEPYVTGDGGPFEEKQDPVSCLTTFKGIFTAGVGGLIYRGANDTAVITAPIREVGGDMLTGMELMGAGVCARDTGNGIWCWDGGIPILQEDDVWADSKAATQILENDGEPLRVLSGDAFNPGNDRACFVRTDNTIACWGNNGDEGAPLFPSTPGCTKCASSPVTVLTEGQTGEPLTDIQQVFTHTNFIMAVDTAGQLWFWGNSAVQGFFEETPSLPLHHPHVAPGLPPLDAAYTNGATVCGVVSSDRSLLCKRTDEEEWVAIATEEGELITNVRFLEPVFNAFGIVQEDGSFLVLKAASGDPLFAQEMEASNQPITDIQVMNGVPSGHNLHLLDSSGNFWDVHPYPSNFYYTKYDDASDLPDMFATPCLECVPKCGVKDCSSDGCGGQCWNCATDDHICIDGVCVPPECTPDCPPESCGDDGCGGSCGTCPDGEVCHENECEKGACIVDVSGRMGLTRDGNVVYMCPPDSNCKYYEPSGNLVPLGGEILGGVTELMDTSSYLTCARLEDESIVCFSASGNINSSLVTSEDGGNIDTLKGYALSEADGTAMTDVAHMSNNGVNNCIVRNGGNLECWGYAGWLFLSAGTEDVIYPTPIYNEEDGEPVTDAKTVSVDYRKACFIRTDGSVWCWGYEGFGIGVTGWNDSDSPQPYPEKVEGLPGPATDLSLSSGSMCALLEDTSVWCWGRSAASLIGISEGTNYEYIHYPEPVRYGPYGEIVTGVVDVIHSTNNHSTLLMENGDILTWGQGGWVAASQFVPSPTWLPWEGLPVQDAQRIAISPVENARYIFRTNGELIVSSPKSGNVYTKQSIGLYDELCE